MGGPTTAPQQGLVLPQKPFRDELASEASEPSEGAVRRYFTDWA